MEEWIGKHWHNFIAQRGSERYPQAAVMLDGYSKSLGLLFRAFGGDGGLKIDAIGDQQNIARRSWLQRLSGNHRHIPLAWRDQQSLSLPAQLDIFPTTQLNKDLYLWLTAMAAADVPSNQSWVCENQQRVVWVLQHYRGLRSVYLRLLDAQFAIRPGFYQLKGEEAQLEQTIQIALHSPGLVAILPSITHEPQPVYLWLHPHPPVAPENLVTEDLDSANEEHDGEMGESQDGKQTHRYRAEQTEMPDGKDGMLAMRWEAIFSWGEYIKVDRCTDEDEDAGAADIARDMDKLTVARDDQTSASRLRLDLDLPSPEYDDVPIAGPHPLPEWDWRNKKLIPDHCQLQLMLPRDSKPQPLPAHLRLQARRLRSQFSAMAQQRSWQNAQADGSEVDLQAYLDFYSARRRGIVMPERGLYRQLKVNRRDIATLLLADLSLSTDAAIDDNQRIIDVIRDSLLLFAEALNSCGDQFALHGFSSRRRDQVRFYPLKNFDQPYNDQVRGHIQAIRPGYYTRMGAAIRESSKLLSQQAVSQRLLLILTDGKPNDLDYYEGRYGVEDTREAIREAKQLGLIPYCITIDREGDDYLPYIFGAQGYTVIQRPEQLPIKLLSLYSQLSQ